MNAVQCFAMVLTLLGMTAGSLAQSTSPTTAPASGRPQVAAYYFPGYHPDRRTDAWHGKGWSEWELVKRAEPRFDGHQQPKRPLWGHRDESDPAAMEQKIDAAADHAVDAFIFDWYWYEDGPFLDGALERGYLKAKNNGRVKFAIMWANHDWLDIHPASHASRPPVLVPGKISHKAFDAATDHVIKTYFTHPSYWRVEGRPYFSIYETMTLVQSMGGMEETRKALDDFRARARAAGVGEIHLNAVLAGIQILPGEKTIKDPDAMVRALGLDSVTSYVWVHHQPLPTFPRTPYAEIREKSVADWATFTTRFTVPYFPNVTMGWDASPRTIQSDRFDNHGYPNMTTMGGNTPAEFETALRQVKQFMADNHTTPPIVTINAWNEWTEGSYLEPDEANGMKYLQAVRDVFGRQGTGGTVR